MRVISCMVHDHNLVFVLMAALLCLSGSLVASTLIRRTFLEDGMAKAHWCFLSAVTAGAATWATHFIAMLGYAYEIERGLSLARTVGSLALACVLFAFSVVPVMRGYGCQRCRIVAAAALTVSIGSMHYVGMSAYEASALLVWDRGMVAVSFVLGFVFNLASVQLFTTKRSSGRLIVCPILFVLAICAIHFLGMAALTVVPLDTSVGAWSGNSTVLAAGTLVTSLRS